VATCHLHTQQHDFADIAKRPWCWSLVEHSVGISFVQARIVRMMMDYELKTAEQGKNSILPGAMGRWARRYKRRMENKMVAIGDGAD